MYYFTEFFIGSDKQSLRFMTDTSSESMWLALTDCRNCPTISRYRPDKSSTFVQQDTIIEDFEYNLGSVYAELISDDVQLGKFNTPSGPELSL